MSLESLENDSLSHNPEPDFSEKAKEENNSAKSEPDSKQDLDSDFDPQKDKNYSPSKQSPGQKKPAEEKRKIQPQKLAHSFKNLCRRKLFSIRNYLITFLKWVIVASVTGCAGGFTGGLFHESVKYVTELHSVNGYLIFFLPFGGLLIALMYKGMKLSNDPGTNIVLSSVRSHNEVPIIIAPLIFASTVITQLFGGSAGREGAALQLGGSIGRQIGKIFRLDEKDVHIVIMCGMSAVFSALFGTPLTAVLFAIEVISVGVFYYSALVPCLISSVAAFSVSSLMGASPLFFLIENIPEAQLLPLIKTVALGALCAVVSIIFCIALKNTAKLFKKLFKNPFIRIFVGGCGVAALTLLVNTRRYNGTGMEYVEFIFSGGEAFWYDFILKIIFTAITISAGFKGGEIVPTMFIGASFGCFAGGILGLDPQFSAAVGLVATFCGVVNCPVASIILSVELFGAEGLLFFAAAAFVSYMLSGYYGLYSSQKILYSKLKAEFININAK